MKTLAIAGALSCAVASAASAGGVDRSGQPLGAIFTPGNYIEYRFTSVNPSISGEQLGGGPGSGDQALSYGTVGVTLKFAVSEKIDVALIYGQPFGASIDYPDGTGFYAAGAEANLATHAVSTVGRYKFGNGFSAHAGLRHQTYYSSAEVPFVANWTGSSTADHSFGYLAGIAYERPEMALRVALTYFSKVTHDLPTVETSTLQPGGTSSVMTVETPQAVNLDFQTGVAPGTLVFGGVRWVNWSDFDITPAHYETLTGRSLVAFRDDTFTYTLGVGRQLTENWAVSLTAVHEPKTGGFRSNLRPVDGRSSVGLGVTYTQDNFKIQAGMQHVWLGDGTTTLDQVNPAAEFEDNTALAFGMRLGFNF